MNSNKNKSVLVIVGYHFPSGEAGSGRMMNFCRLFFSLGYDVHVVAAYTKDKSLQVGKEYYLDGISYEIATLDEPTSIDSFWGNKNFLECIKTNINKEFDIVFTSSLNDLFLKIAPLCKKKKSKLFVEQCEWMDISSYKFGKLDFRYWRVNYLRKKGYKQADGIISISRLLDEFYLLNGIKSIRIPTILKLEDFNQEHDFDTQKIHLLFAGSLGASKELLAPIISAIAQSQEFSRKFILDIYGPSSSQIRVNINDDNLFESAQSYICVHERVSQDQMSEVFFKADFLIFIRPERKSSHAGFPTKLAESMAVGTPVITNNTGDISLYLKDGFNGYLLEDNSSRTIINCLENIADLSLDQYKKLRKNAYETAKKNFDYCCYSELLNKLIESGE